MEAGLIEEIYPLNEYLDNIIDAVDMGAIRQAGLKIAIDPMYGVSETSLKTILLTARCDVQMIHERHDTLFGGNCPHLPPLPLEGFKPLSSTRNAISGWLRTGMLTASE